MADRERLFGFNMTDTSALLLFIASFGLMLTGFYFLYITITLYNATGTIAPLHFLLTMLILITAIYIMFKTLTFRKKNYNTKIIR